MSDKYPPGRVKGWMYKGPDYSQDWQGWKIYADKESEDMVPVMLVGIEEEDEEE